ncbi:MAG: hypothetical protein LBH96_04955 [Candidatus Peribacteria bacterium]|jgi:hypothetical protein|nr:hypothetical protein [Candidatus Peribacteria bacterium]
MKKISAFVALASVMVFSVTYAATPSITELLQNASFGYSDTDKISVETIDTSKITLVSPIIRDIGGDYVQIYRTTYSPYLIEDLELMDTQTLSTTMKSIDTRLRSGEPSVKIMLGVEDGLTASETYYVMVTPVDMYDALGTSSQQLCFNLEKELYAMGDDCLTFKEEHSSATTNAELEHNAPRADMSLANITHTINGNTVSLGWTRVEGSDKIDIFLFDPSVEKFVRLDSVKMSDEKYDYVMKWDGEHIFRFIPLDGGREYDYNVQAMRTSTEEPKKEEKPVVTPVQV